MTDILGPRPNAQKYEAAARHQIAERLAQGQLPRPLTPPDCDVSTFAGPILNVARLKGSVFWMRADPRTKAAAIELWMFAWRQTPAASLPNDPLTLSRVTGISARSMRTILAGEFQHTPCHGFIRCDDGRLYHPVIAGDALRAFKTRQSREIAAAARHQKALVSGVISGGLRRVPGSGRGRYGTESDYDD